MTKKIAVFSDIHGNLQALSSIIKDIKEKKIDTIYCLGDVIGIGPNPKECLDLIIENNIEMVLGNHELYFLKGTNIDKNIDKDEKEHHVWISKQLNKTHTEFLNKCPLAIVKQYGKQKICFQHFILKKDNNTYPFEDLNIINENIEQLDADITFIGHEHKPFEIIVNDKKIIDVGSSGCTKDENTFYTIISFEDDKINLEKVNLRYDRKSFEENFKKISHPDKEIIGKIFFGID